MKMKSFSVPWGRVRVRLPQYSVRHMLREFSLDAPRPGYSNMRKNSSFNMHTVIGSHIKI